jgi:hypothetical protein
VNLSDVFAGAGDCRDYGAFARLAERVSAVIRGSGIADDVRTAVEGLPGALRLSEALEERGARPGQSLPLFAAPNLVARLTPTARGTTGRSALGSLSEHTLFAVASGGPVRVRRFVVPQPPAGRFDGPLCDAGTQTLEVGDALTFDALHETFDVVEIGADSLLLTAASARVSETLREYDPDDLSYRRSTASSPRESRLRFALMAFSAFPPNQNSIEAVCAMLDHPTHHVRWNAVEALATMAPARGRAALRGALDDPHPHVRTAAARTLERMHVADPAR